MLSKLAPIDNDSAESMQETSKNLCEIIVKCRKSMLKHPKDPEFPGILHFCLQKCCDWNDYEDRLKKLSRLIDKHLRDNLKPPVGNLSINLYPFSLQQQLGIATYFAQLVTQLSILPIEYQLRGERLRIGYLLSGTTTFPLVGKRSLHNLDKFEIFYYNYALGDVDPIQPDDQSKNENVCDLSQFCSNEAAAKRIAADGIQILINLVEFSDKDGKLNGILELRPAPIQVVYRCNLDSTGASYMDYFITDKVASPLQFAYGYSEKLAYMPNGMFVCNDTELLTKPQANLEETETNRRRCRLPQSAIVFAVESVAAQIDPDTFECWCEILQRVPKSVLWLLTPHYDLTKSNLKREAKRHKINSNRLIFIDKSEVVGWTSMKDLVDVVLDTPMCNCRDLIIPICCGIPVVTMPRKSFLSRQTASVLTSIGCDELIAKSTWEYVQIAVNLGNKPDLLEEMRAKMREILPDSNLFRVDQYFNDLENLYEQMWKWREMGEKAEHLVCGNPHPLPCLL